MKFILIFISLVFQVSTARSQNATAQVTKHNQAYEYLNVHTDRDLYLAGETIWYKLYLGNHQNNVNDLSVVAYVEVIDAEGKILLRNKNKCTEGMSQGSISLPDEMPSSTYTLKAYTLWTLKLDDNLSFKKQIVILKQGDSSVYEPPSKTQRTSDCANLETIMIHNGHVKIRFSKAFYGRIVAHYRGVILHEIEVGNPMTEISFVVKNKIDNSVTISLFDLNRNLLCDSQHHDTANVTSTLDIMVKPKVRPREKIDIELVLKNSAGKSVTGNFSISIHRDWNSLTQAIEKQNLYPNPTQVQNTQQVGKELMLYPQSPESLPAISIRQNSAIPENKNTNQIFLPPTWTDFRSLVAEVNKSYRQPEHHVEYEESYLPYDDIYYPEDYLALPSLEEFFIEIVDQLKFTRKKGKSSIAIRNTENRNNVFVYKNAPLIIIDGFIYDNIDDVLSINPDLIDKLTLSWKAHTLSKVSLAKLADHGVLALYTKNGINLTANNKLGQGIYEQYHRPKVFPLERNTQITIPDFRQPLFWNPHLTVHGKARVSLNTSNEVGDFIIEVEGMSDGNYITKQVKFTVIN